MSVIVTPVRAGWLVPARRLQRVALVLARHGFGELVDRINMVGVADVLPAGARASGNEDLERLGARIARVLTDLGPTYIKLGQLLATRADLFPQEIIQALSKLHAQAAPMPPHITMRTIERALGMPVGVAFQWWNPTPLAAASIGQVHRARLKSGEHVVLKVQRPGLRPVVAADLALLRVLAQLLAQTSPELQALDPLALVEAFERSILAELDFYREADNARRLAELLAGAPEVRVPLVYAEWTRPGLLVLEHVQGQRLDQLDEPARRRARRRLLRAFARQVLDHGVFHADPHPGNVLVEPDGRLVLLDLGAVDEIDRTLRAGLVRLVRAAALRRKAALADAVIALAPKPIPRLDRPRLEHELAVMVDTVAAQGGGARVLAQMVAVGRTHRLRMAPALLTLVRALALLDGVLRGLDPTRDPVVDLRREMALAAVRKALRPARMVTRFVVRVVVYLEQRLQVAASRV
jgi:ubiquinone biosynthesis protein